MKAIPQETDLQLTLTPAETTRLAELEATIDRHLAGFVACGRALAEIRDSRLYRNDYGDFQSYCQDKWQFSRQRANQLIAAAEVVNNLAAAKQQSEKMATIVAIPLPYNEGQARALTQLEREDQVRVWQSVLEKSKESAQPITASVIKREAHALKAAQQPLPSRTRLEPTDDGGFEESRHSSAYLKLSTKFFNLIKEEADAGWPTVSRTETLRELRIILEYAEARESNFVRRI